MATKLEIPAALTQAVCDEGVVLFLGAGASRGAAHPSNSPILTADGLRDALSDRFLGGELKDRPLKVVSDLAISERDLITVQTFIREVFLPFGPADFHLILPTIPWHGIATTNYDLIVERAYEASSGRCQQLLPIVSDEQHIDTELKRYPNGLTYLKLHGCIEHTTNKAIPLVLSTEQYARHLDTRSRLYARFQDWGHEFTFLFCGYSISDAHIQSILFDLFDKGTSRPRYYVVDPGVSEMEARYWESHSITAVRSPLDGFLKALRSALPTHVGPLASLSSRSGLASISKHYGVAQVTESPELLSFLADDVDHVRSGMPTSGRDAREFYRGNDTGWVPIESNLDARRGLNDNVLSDAVLIEESEHQKNADLFVIKGPAGNGKTVSLKRIAWDAATEFDKLVLFLREGGTIRLSALQEINDLTRQRLFLFVDSAARHVAEIDAALTYCDGRNIPLTIVTAERDNEWNQRCEALDGRVVREYPLRYLAEHEIARLLVLLEAHGALGLLEELTPQQRTEAFVVRAQRQLLVALHEATEGRPFEEIVVDEYSRVTPDSARLLYLDVCTLNRLGVGVRAGLISRLSGISLTDFRRDFVAPLEHVVRAYNDKYGGDHLYAARHAHVAEIVFDHVLADEEARFEQVARMVDALNISFGTDLEALNQLIRARAVLDAFSSYELGERLYRLARTKLGENAFLLQQQGNFERIHPRGSLGAAAQYLERAFELAPHNRSIQNSLAVLRRAQANDARNPLERAEHRRRAKRELTQLVGASTAKPQDYSALAEIELDRLRDLIPRNDEESPISERQMLEAAEAVDQAIAKGFQRFPEHEFLFQVEAKYRSMLSEHSKATEALRRAAEKNPRNEWVATRYADYLVEQEQVEEAKSALVNCIQNRPGAKLAHLAIARIYQRHGNDAERSLVRDHLRKSFVDGDANVEAQYLYARQLFVEANYTEAEQRFAELRDAKLSPALRGKVREKIRDVDGSAKKFVGTVSRRDEAYCFVTCDAFKNDVYCHVSAARDEEWARIRMGGRVRLEIGFNFRGPCAALIEPIADA